MCKCGQVTTAQTLNEKWLAFKWLEKISRSVTLFIAKTFRDVALFFRNCKDSCIKNVAKYSKCHSILFLHLSKISNFPTFPKCHGIFLHVTRANNTYLQLSHNYRSGITSKLHSFHRTSSFIPGRFVIAVPRVKLSNWVCADSCTTRNIAHWKRSVSNTQNGRCLPPTKASYWFFTRRMWQRHVQLSQPKTAVRGRQQLCRLAARTWVQS